MEEEQEAVRQYVATHRFPTYEEASQMLMPILSLWCEFSDFHYQCLKKCYENATDRQICREIGERINRAGGMYGMATCYSIYKIISPLLKSNDETVQYYVKMLSWSWSDVDEWIH